MKKCFLISFIFFVSMNLFSKEMKIDDTLMITDNWYTSNTFDETGTYIIEFPDNWDLSSSVIYNDKNEKIAEPKGNNLYKINIGQRYEGVVLENLKYVDYDSPVIIEKKDGKNSS